MTYKRLHAPKTNLRAWRKYRGLTQLAVQERLGMHVYRLSHIETGHAPLNEETLNALAGLYDCSADDLLNREPGGKILTADRLPDEIERDLAAVRNELDRLQAEVREVLWTLRKLLAVKS